MSPCCVVLASSAVGNAPLSHLQHLEANSLLLAALSSLKGTACYPPANAETSEDGSSLFAPLVELSTSPLVEAGTVTELVVYKDWVRRKLRAAAELASKSRVWRDSGVVEKLQRAIALVENGQTNKGRELACEVLGFSQLQSLATSNLQLTCYPASSAGASNSSACDLTSGGSGVAQFKVPALPAKRGRQQLENGQLPQDTFQSQQESKHHEGSIQQQPHRKHSAPKRRATPQVLPAAPFVLATSAAPDSSTHGETCCDEGMLSCWCPISGKRQRSSPDAAADSFISRPGIASSSSCPNSSSVLKVSATEAASSRGTSADASTSCVKLDSSSKAAEEVPAVGPSTPKAVHSAASSSRAATHAEAVEALKQKLHEDPSLGRPSPDVLLFNKVKQQPIHNWSGIIKHRLKGRVVDLCKLTLQVPEPFLEEFPAALYAAEIRHRRSVSLGRHVVCRATLGTLSEHQLASLAAMARGQLVALCTLQTAELHLVPYFDNKNLVRMVGFLKIKAE